MYEIDDMKAIVGSQPSVNSETAVLDYTKNRKK